MPELPEVETVRNTLKNHILNKKIIKIDVYYNGIIEDDINYFKNSLINQSIEDIDRVGKFLIFKFNDIALVSHLRMEGRFYYAHLPNGDKNFGDLFVNRDKHTHVIFTFSDNTLLMYNDTRKFGKMKLLPKDDYLNYPPLNKLGKEPFYLQPNEFYHKIHHSNKLIKNLLLDQSIIAGLGNIYCDEVLNLSMISPFKKGKDITLEEASKIVLGARKVLLKAIDLGGSTIRSYHSSNGVDGKFQNELRVYGHEDEQCLNCGNYIVKTFINGRGTHFCPVCQSKAIENNPKIIGLTGFMGSGKSTVSSYLKNKGYNVIDADEIVRNLYLKDNLGYKIILETFKDEDLTNDFGIDHLKLRDYVLKNNKVNVLNELVHPLVKNEIIKNINVGEIVFLDVPLLFEVHLDQLCDLTILVSVTKKKQLERLAIRNNMPIQDAKKLIANQMSRSEKYFLADIILDNNKDLQHLYNQIEQILEAIIG